MNRLVRVAIVEPLARLARKRRCVPHHSQRCTPVRPSRWLDCDHSLCSRGRHLDRNGASRVRAVVCPRALSSSGSVRTRSPCCIMGYRPGRRRKRTVSERGRRPPVVGSSISVSEATALYKGNEPPTPSMGLGKGRAHREAVHQCWTLHWIDELVKGPTASPASWESSVLRGCARPMHLLPSHAGCG
jgi:hypothetical protein